MTLYCSKSDFASDKENREAIVFLKERLLFTFLYEWRNIVEKKHYIVDNLAKMEYNGQGGHDCKVSALDSIMIQSRK